MINNLYPKIKPYNTFRLKVSDLHEIFIEESGNQNGRPIIFLHGGPGGGIESIYRQYFNPNKWRIIIFDQRGCGKSTPHAELKENTTWNLVDDIEKIRKKLNINTWTVFGGSWGSTLSLAYSIMYPDQCDTIILRGIFMLRKKEIDWFYQEGCNFIYPDAWEKYIFPIPRNERLNMIKAYYKRLLSNNRKIRIEAAKAWTMWEASTSKLFQSKKALHAFENENFAEAFARIECHYFINKGFFETEDWILNNVHKISKKIIKIVQGRYDVVCPMISAWDLHKALPKSELHIIQDSGHSMSENGIRKKLIEITDKI